MPKDTHKLILSFKLKPVLDIMLKKFQSQDLLPLLRKQKLTQAKLETMVKQLLLMLKNQRTSLTVELTKPTLNSHMPQLFFNLITDTGLNQFQSQDLLLQLLLLQPTLALKEKNPNWPLSMPKILKISLMEELNWPIPDSHMLQPSELEN
jgi:hypothetical protein